MEDMIVSHITWISVDFRLPDEQEEVLVYVKYADKKPLVEFISTALYRDECWRDPFGSPLYDYKVLYWAKFPEYPCS